MPTNHVRTATDDPKRLEVQPVKLADSTPKRGRPKTNIQPRTPQFELEPEVEAALASFVVGRR